jgi:predicted nucleic acid-binding protein
MFLRLAVAGKAVLLVTGDRDLLALGGIFKVPIVPPSEALRAIG